MLSYIYIYTSHPIATPGLNDGAAAFFITAVMMSSRALPICQPCCTKCPTALTGMGAQTVRRLSAALETGKRLCQGFQYCHSLATAAPTGWRISPRLERWAFSTRLSLVVWKRGWQLRSGFPSVRHLLELVQWVAKSDDAVAHKLQSQP